MHVWLLSSTINSSVFYSIRRYHLQCVCHEAAWAALEALSSAAALLERHIFTRHLSPARYTYLVTRQHFLATAKQNQQDFSSRESTLDFLSDFSQPAFLNGDFHLASLIGCYASSFISLVFSLWSSCSTYGTSQLLTIVAKSPSLKQLISDDD